MGVRSIRISSILCGAAFAVTLFAASAPKSLCADNAHRENCTSRSLDTLSPTAKEAIAILQNATQFMVGQDRAGIAEAEETIAFRSVLRETAAPCVFMRMLDSSSISAAGKLYALCGLYHTSPAEFMIEKIARWEQWDCTIALADGQKVTTRPLNVIVEKSGREMFRDYGSWMTLGNYASSLLPPQVMDNGSSFNVLTTRPYSNSHNSTLIGVLQTADAYAPNSVGPPLPGGGLSGEAKALRQLLVDMPSPMPYIDLIESTTTTLSGKLHAMKGLLSVSPRDFERYRSRKDLWARQVMFFPGGCLGGPESASTIIERMQNKQ
jgi:hypothetical protein